MKTGIQQERGLGNRTFKAVVMSMTCALAFQSFASAQDAGEAEETQPDEGERALDTVYVSGARAMAATKTMTPITEVPQSISVVTGDEIADRTAVDLQDIFRYSAGVAPSQSVDSRGDFINARGFDAAQYLDGLKRMPDFIYGARLENYTLERAEVLRGPSSVLYGAGGPGGVLNGVSKTPQFDFAGEAGISVGTDNRMQFQGDVTGALTDQLAGRLVVLARDGETQWGTPDDRILINPSLTWVPGPNTEITLIGLYQDDQNGSLGYVPLSKSLLAGSEAEKVDFNFYQGEPGFNGMDTTFASGSLLVSHKFMPNLTFRSSSRYADMDTDYKEVYGDFSDGVTPFADAEETLLQREFYVNLEKSEVINTDNNLLWEVETGPFEHSILVGVDYTSFDQSKDEGFSCDGFEGFFGCFAGGSPPPINIYNPQYGADFDYGYTNFLEYSSTQLGFYAQDQITYNDWLHVLLGLRHDTATSERNGVDEIDQDNVSFRGGIIADVTENLSPYFSYAESFLPVPGGDFFGNPFEPRTARQYEVGAKWEPRSGALFTVALFDIEESNFVSQDPNNIQNFLQGGVVGSQGVELEAVIRMPQDFDFMASYSYTEAEVLEASQSLAEGDRIASIPEHLASVWTTKTFNLDNGWTLKAGGGVRYVGDNIDASQTFLTPSVTLVDAVVSADYGKWRLSLNASNLFNEEYYANCAISSAPYGYCVAGKDRTLIASVMRKF